MAASTTSWAVESSAARASSGPHAEDVEIVDYHQLRTQAAHDTEAAEDALAVLAILDACTY